MEIHGHECSCHILALSVVNTFVKKLDVFKKLRGMTTHFNLSTIGAKLLLKIQEDNGCNEVSKPPKHTDTRSGWGGAYLMAVWYAKNEKFCERL